MCIKFKIHVFLSDIIWEFYSHLIVPIFDAISHKSQKNLIFDAKLEHKALEKNTFRKLKHKAIVRLLFH